MNCSRGWWGQVGRGWGGGGPSVSDMTAIYFQFHEQAAFASCGACIVSGTLQDGLTGSQPVCHHHPHHDDEDDVPSDLPGEEHAALPAGLPLLSFIPLLPPSPPTSLRAARSRMRLILPVSPLKCRNLAAPRLLTSSQSQQERH